MQMDSLGQRLGLMTSRLEAGRHRLCGTWPDRL